MGCVPGKKELLLESCQADLESGKTLREYHTIGMYYIKAPVKELEIQSSIPDSLPRYPHRVVV